MNPAMRVAKALEMAEALKEGDEIAKALDDLADARKVLRDADVITDQESFLLRIIRDKVWAKQFATIRER